MAFDGHLKMGQSKHQQDVIPALRANSRLGTKRVQSFIKSIKGLKARAGVRAGAGAYVLVWIAPSLKTSFIVSRSRAGQS